MPTAGGDEAGAVPADPVAAPADPEPATSPLFEGHRDFAENQRGVSFDSLLMPYLAGAEKMTLQDPYVRASHQGRNLVELLAAIASAKDPADNVTFVLITAHVQEAEYQQKQLLMLKEIQDRAAQHGIDFKVSFSNDAHDRWIKTDTGWRINLGRGLDIFQKSDGGWMGFGSSRQEFRQVREFGVTYVRESGVG